MTILKFVDNLATKENMNPVINLYNELINSGVKVECHPGKTSPYTGNGNIFATADYHHYEDVWKIYHPTNAEAYQIYHELLHVYFNCINKAPIMASLQPDEQFRKNVAEMNNDFDHAYIIPLETHKYPEAAVYWQKQYEKTFNNICSSRSTHVIQKKLTLLRGWLVLSRVISTIPIGLAFGHELEKMGWLEAANVMVAQVEKAGANKKQVAEAFRNALGFDFPPSDKITFS